MDKIIKLWRKSNIFTNKTKRIPLKQSLTKEILEDLYFVQNNSLEDIARLFDCSKAMVHQIMKQYGFERRKRSNARVLAIKKGKLKQLNYDDINEEFFIEWSNQMAWVLGLLFTDGNLSKGKTGCRVSISSKDYELLEKIKYHLNSTKQIDIKVQSYDETKYIYHFAFSREKMIKDLSELGLVQRKSLIMEFPVIPEEYIRHFIRGCWDGDGTAYISKDGKFNTSYVCGSRDFMEKLIIELFKAGIYRKRLISHSKNETRFWKVSNFPSGMYPLALHKDNRSKVYTIKLNSKENLLIFFRYLYDGVPDSMYLTRKYDVFVNGLKKSKL